MTQKIFSDLWDTIRDTSNAAVLQITIGDTVYLGYSQSVPAVITDSHQVRFAIFFLKPKNASHGEINELNESTLHW